MSMDTEHWSSPNGCHPDCPACEAERRLTMEERGKLARDVFAAVFDQCESFTEQDIGKDLAYLMGAILDDTADDDCNVDWSDEIFPAEKPEVLRILKEKFTTDHAVWKFIIL